MKHIIKPGTKLTATCHECGCVFSYEKEDIDCEVYRNEVWKWITCPQCNAKIEIIGNNAIRSNGNIATKE